MTENKTRLMGRPRSEDSRQSILTATLWLLAEGGYEGITFEAVSIKAGVGKSTIYRWYGTREDLVEDAFSQFKFDTEVPNTGSLAGDIEAIVANAQATEPWFSDGKAFGMMLSAISASDRLSEAYWEKYIKPRRTAFNVIFLRAKERGEFGRAADPAIFGELLHGGILLNMLAKPRDTDRAKEARRIVEQLLKGFGS